MTNTMVYYRKNDSKLERARESINNEVEGCVAFVLMLSPLLANFLIPMAVIQKFLLVPKPLYVGVIFGGMLFLAMVIDDVRAMRRKRKEWKLVIRSIVLIHFLPAALGVLVALWVGKLD